MRYLRNSLQIRQELNTLFSEEGSKWAVVGFVGYNALDFLPEAIADLSVVCWPKAGGTNPDGVRRLIDNGISVYFCDRLHQKIYWRDNAGLIVGSANLSDNALGDGNLHEFGVYCDDKNFDINEVLGALNYVPVTTEALVQLDIEHAARQQDNINENIPNTVPSFPIAMRMRHPKQFKLITWSERRENSDHIRAEVETHFGTRNWINDNDVDSNSFQVGEFVLCVHTNDEGIIESANGRWLFVDLIIKNRRNRAEAVVQVYKLGNRNPPFLIDATFKKHLKRAFNTALENSHEFFDENYVVQSSCVNAISKLYADDVANRTLCATDSKNSF